MYCKHTLLGTNISPPKAIWRWLSFYQGGICLFPGGYCILVIIIFQEFRPILLFTQEIADAFSPEKLTMELLTGTSFSSFFCTQTKTIKVYNEIIPNGIIPSFHRLCHPIGRHPIGHHQSSPATVHSQLLKNHPPKSPPRWVCCEEASCEYTCNQSMLCGRPGCVFCVIFVGSWKVFFPRIGICSILVCWLVLRTLPIIWFFPTIYRRRELIHSCHIRSTWTAVE